MWRGRARYPPGRSCPAAALAAALVACAPTSEPPPKALLLDCAQPFEAQKARLVAQPDLVAAPPNIGEPYRFYSMADGKASYLITAPGADAHPAIMMQRVAGHDVITTGCAYGDKAGYGRLLAYLDSLKTWRRKRHA